MTFLVGRPCPLRYSTLELSLTLSTVFLALVMRSSFLLPTIPWSFYFACYGNTNCHWSCQFLFSDVAASFVFVFFPTIIVALFFLVTSKLSSSFILLLAVIFHHLVSFSFFVVLFIDYCDIFTLFLVPHITKVSTCLGESSPPRLYSGFLAVVESAYQRHLGREPFVLMDFLPLVFISTVCKSNVVYLSWRQTLESVQLPEIE